MIVEVIIIIASIKTITARYSDLILAPIEP